MGSEDPISIMARRSFNRKDRFYHKAKKEGYPARSAYKIIELDKRFQIFKPGHTIVDIGCAPGGWLKVAEEKMDNQGTLVGIDLLPLHYQKQGNTHFLQDDFTLESSRQWMKDKIPQGAHWVISDISPNLSGVKFKDRFESYELCLLAMNFAVENLRPKGSFLCKLFPGKEVEEFRTELKKHFKKLKSVVPEATRTSSTEIYVVASEKKD